MARGKGRSDQGQEEKIPEELLSYLDGCDEMVRKEDLMAVIRKGDGADRSGS